MAEQHDIAGAPRGEPLREGRHGVRVRVPLTGTPSAHWSHVLSAQLHIRLSGRRTGRHLTLARVVHGADVVLDGVRDEDEARELGRVVREAVAAVNDVVGRSECPREPNASQPVADGIAAAFASTVAPPVVVGAITSGEALPA